LNIAATSIAASAEAAEVFERSAVFDPVALFEVATREIIESAFLFPTVIPTSLSEPHRHLTAQPHHFTTQPHTTTSLITFQRSMDFDHMGSSGSSSKSSKKHSCCEI
jgi:hypothetical protein